MAKSRPLCFPACSLLVAFLWPLLDCNVGYFSDDDVDGSWNADDITVGSAFGGVNNEDDVDNMILIVVMSVIVVVVVLIMEMLMVMMRTAMM